MDKFQQAILSGLTECFDQIWTKVDNLSIEELRWTPSKSSNDIQWNIWHIARVEDRWINQRMKSTEEIWINKKWYKHFNLEESDHGNGDTIEKVRKMPNMKIEDLKKYFDEVREKTVDFITNIPPKKLTQIYPVKNSSIKMKSHKYTGIWILGHLLVEESQHLGQIAYLRGIIKGLNK